MVTPRRHAVEVSASARAEDVVGAIMDTALEAKRKEQQSWINRSSFTWTKAGIVLLVFLSFFVVSMVMSASGGPIKLDDHSDLAYEKDYEIFKEAHQEAGMAFDDPDADFLETEKNIIIVDEDFSDDMEDEYYEPFEDGEAVGRNRHVVAQGHGHHPEHEPGQGNPRYGHLGHRKHEFEEHGRAT